MGPAAEIKEKETENRLPDTRKARNGQPDTEAGSSAKVQPDTDRRFMKAALTQAKKALAKGEVPIGCVIVYEGRIIGRGYNRRNTDKTTIAHAEISAIRKASKFINDWRLEGCTLYCTLEPCQMCAGAIVQARIDRVVIGALSPKAGCAGTLLNILQNPDFNHQAEVTDGVMAGECSALLAQFFKELRLKNRMRKAEDPGSDQEPFPAKPLNRSF